jgi:hypothetical protein
MMGDILKIAVRSSDAATGGRTSTGLGGLQVDGRTRRGGLGRACRPGNDHSHAAFYQIPTSRLPLYLDSCLEKCVAMKVRLLRFPSVSKARLASTATMRTSAVSTTTFNPRRSSRARPCRSWTRSSVSRPLRLSRQAARREVRHSLPHYRPDDVRSTGVALWRYSWPSPPTRRWR